MAMATAEKEPLQPSSPVIKAGQIKAKRLPVLTRHEMQDSFLRGFFRAFSLVPNFAPPSNGKHASYLASASAADEVEGIAGDWMRVGNDLRTAILKYELGEHPSATVALDRQSQHIAEIICPECGESASVNKLDREGIVVTPCQKCHKQIEVQTDYTGRITHIGLVRHASLWSLWLTLIVALTVWMAFARIHS